MTSYLEGQILLLSSLQETWHLPGGPRGAAVAAVRSGVCGEVTFLPEHCPRRCAQGHRRKRRFAMTFPLKPTPPFRLRGDEIKASDLCPLRPLHLHTVSASLDAGCDRHPSGPSAHSRALSSRRSWVGNPHLLEISNGQEVLVELSCIAFSPNTEKCVLLNTPFRTRVSDLSLLLGFVSQAPCVQWGRDGSLSQGVWPEGLCPQPQQGTRG